MQQELARQVGAVGTPVVVVEVSGMAVGMDFIAQQSNWPLIVGGYGGRFAPVCLDPCLAAVQLAHWYSHSTNRTLKEPNTLDTLEMSFACYCSLINDHLTLAEYSTRIAHVLSVNQW